MTRNRKITLAVIIALVLTLAVVIVALGASKTKCKSYYSGGVKVAKLCYKMNVTWHEPQEEVRCNNSGSAYYYIYKSGWRWTSTGKYCSPTYYTSRVNGAAFGRLNGSYKYVQGICNGDEVNKWYWNTR